MRDDTKISKITDIVKDKTVIVCGNSPTLSFLVNNKELVQNNDKTVLCGVNKWTPIERDLHRKMDIICLGRNLMEDHNIEFSNRGNNIMIPVVSCRKEKKYRAESAGRMKFLKQCNPDSLVVVRTNREDGPNKDKFCIHIMDSIMVLALCSMYGLPSRIFFFGCDAGITDDFSEEEKRISYYGHPESRDFRDYSKSTKLVTKKFKKAMNKINKIHNIPIPPMHIVGLHSGYDFASKITKEQSLKMLNED